VKRAFPLRLGAGVRHRPAFAEMVLAPQVIGEFLCSVGRHHDCFRGNSSIAAAAPLGHVGAAVVGMMQRYVVGPMTAPAGSARPRYPLPANRACKGLPAKHDLRRWRIG